MAGRPALRIGQHGKIVREYLRGGVWLARTRYRDGDGSRGGCRGSDHPMNTTNMASWQRMR